MKTPTTGHLHVTPNDRSPTVTFAQTGRATSPWLRERRGLVQSPHLQEGHKTSKLPQRRKIVRDEARTQRTRMPTPRSNSKWPNRRKLRVFAEVPGRERQGTSGTLARPPRTGPKSCVGRGRGTPTRPYSPWQQLFSAKEVNRKAGGR